jgi:hypothetical protein
MGGAITGRAVLSPLTGFAANTWLLHQENMMKASSLSFHAAVLLAVVGMIWGTVMATSKDYTALPAHAHFSLLGWVSLLLFGIFYHLHPAIDRSRLAIVQVCAWVIGVVAMAVGLAAVGLGLGRAGVQIAAVSSWVALGDMLVFGWLVVVANYV